MKGKRKPMTIDAISDSPPPTAMTVQAVAGKGENDEGRRAHVKQLTLYLPHPVYRQLRELGGPVAAGPKMHFNRLDGRLRSYPAVGPRSGGF